MYCRLFQRDFKGFCTSCLTVPSQGDSIQARPNKAHVYEGELAKSLKHMEGSLGTKAVIAVLSKTGYQIQELRDDIAGLPVLRQPHGYIFGYLIRPLDFEVLVTPIDEATPKGTLILPQQHTIRDILESDAVAIVVNEWQLRETLRQLGKKPALMITDSQAFAKVHADTPTMCR